jgi:hypothetical protein
MTRNPDDNNKAEYKNVNNKDVGCIKDQRQALRLLSFWMIGVSLPCQKAKVNTSYAKYLLTATPSFPQRVQFNGQCRF